MSFNPFGIIGAIFGIYIFFLAWGMFRNPPRPLGHDNPPDDFREAAGHITPPDSGDDARIIIDDSIFAEIDFDVVLPANTNDLAPAEKKEYEETKEKELEPVGV